MKRYASSDHQHELHQCVPVFPISMAASFDSALHSLLFFSGHELEGMRLSVLRSGFGHSGDTLVKVEAG
jgi:hypothetical protein